MKPSPLRQEAKDGLCYYFRRALGLKRLPDREREDISSIVDLILDAALEEAKPEATKPGEEIDLVEAALRLQVPWHTAHRLMLTGCITGRREKGRWSVTVDSVDQFLRAEVAP